jgi:hypothetical protein
MNMLYEGLKENATIVIVPSTAVESMQLGGLAGMTALSMGLGQERANGHEEGRRDNERLVEEGIAGAEHDQMRQASLKRESYDRVSIDASRRRFPDRTRPRWQELNIVIRADRDEADFRSTCQSRR